jgi:polysaccharide chain length determinant protein (PEP-CTERM system associated)
MSASGSDFFVRLQQAEAAVREVQAQIDGVSERRRELMRQIEGEAPVFGITSSRGAGGMPTSYDADIARLEQQLSALQVQYTERHPEVLRVQATLDTLYARQAEEREQAQSTAFAGGASELDLNPVFQQLRVSLSNADVELAALRAALRDRQAGVEYLNRMVDTIPDIEAQLVRMDRDYEVLRRQYEALVQRLESARLSEDVQLDTEALTFEVIDPPRLPLTPAGPNRPLLLTGVLIVALGAATALAFLFSQHGPVYFSGSRLSRKTGLPVFGMIATAPGYRSLYSIGLPYMVAVGALIVAYLVLMGGFAALLRDFLPFL